MLVPLAWYRQPDVVACMKPSEFKDLMLRARQNDSQAVGDLLRLFEHEIRLVVRHNLPRRLRVRYDSMDFVQSVYQSIVSDWMLSPVRLFESEVQIKQYLKQTARNKVLEKFRQETLGQKQTITREAGTILRSGETSPPGAGIAEPVSPDPSPSQHAIAHDMIDHLTRGRPPVDRAILNLRHQGLTFDEIAAQVGLSERSVRRRLNELESSISQ